MEGGGRVITTGAIGRAWASLRRVSASFTFFRPDRDDQRTVQRQAVHNRPTDRSHAHEVRAVPPEMITPEIVSWVKDWHQGLRLWINQVLSRPLSQRTRHACKRKVLRTIVVCGRRRNDVIDMKGCLLPDLRQAAILATITCALNDHRPKLPGDRTHSAEAPLPRRSDRSLRRDNNSERFTSPSASSRSPSVSASPRSCRSSRASRRF